MRSRREPARGAIVGVVFLACVVWLVDHGQAGAADVHVEASHDCADRADIANQVDALLDRPVAQVQGLDFDVEIAERPEHRWRLRLVTVGRADGARRSREIDGSGCAQLVDAAAVAIAMSIQARDAAEPRGADTSAAIRAEPPKVTAGPAPGARAPSVQIPIAVAALADVGALPHPAGGLGLGAGLAWGRWLIIGEGALLFSPEARVADSSGGRFRLVVGAVLGCLAEHFGQTGILGCAGGEAGVVQAEGIGINRPRDQNVAWEAGRLELGLVRRLNATVSLVLRAGVAVPWSRPTFTIDNDTLAVHQPGVVTARVTAGALFDLF
jgi:hypothetical protein